MKKWFFGLMILLPFLNSCIKGTDNKCPYTQSSVVAATAEIDSLQNFTMHNGIPASRHSSGAFFVIGSEGSGANPEICSNIKVIYTAYLLTSVVSFDSYTVAGGAGFVLGELIVGWQKVLPVLKAGGSMTLYVPPSLAYGTIEKKDANGEVIIPANSYLKFDINLESVQ